MIVTKSVVAVCLLCFVNGTFGKPSPMYITEGRGIGSTLWDWITYPFYWWSSEEAEPLPANDQLIGIGTTGPFDNIEVAKHNVTVWCNDHTCTTMTCDKYGCKNVSCNIYDTNMNGECREYSTSMKPEEPSSAKPEVTTVEPPKMEDSTVSIKSTEQPETVQLSEEQERPLELEAVLSSTVTEVSPSVKKDKASSSQNKV